MLAGLDLPSSGKVWLAGAELTSMNEDERARLRADRVGFVFQAFHLLPSLTALENVMLPLELQGRNDARALATVPESAPKTTLTIIRHLADPLAT